MNKPEEPLSRGFLLARGYCCHHNCKNCPYEAPNNRDCQLHYEPTDWIPATDDSGYIGSTP